MDKKTLSAELKKLGIKVTDGKVKRSDVKKIIQADSEAIGTKAEDILNDFRNAFFILMENQEMIIDALASDKKAVEKFEKAYSMSWNADQIYAKLL